MADTFLPALVGHARKPFNLQVTRSEDGHINLTVRGMISLSLNGFLLSRALRDAGCPDIDLINEILEDAELVDGDCYGYMLGVGMIDRLHEIAQNTDQPEPERPTVVAPHDARVLDYARSRGEHGRVYSGWCTCGWRGPEQGNPFATHEDIDAHLKSVLPNYVKGRSDD